MNQLFLGNKAFSGIRNIIFDLGGVVVNISYNNTIERFKNIGFSNFDEIFGQMRQSHVFDKYDKGQILPAEFRHELRKVSKLNFTDNDFDNAWNAMILDIPVHRIETLISLRKYYRIFLLSNTNEIHLSYLFNYVDSSFGKGIFESLFDKLYYSCRMGMRKPDYEIYQKVVADSNLVASESLFIDDTDFNVTAAIEAGLQGFTIKKNEDITELFKNSLI
jgi:putative hydrolase of the HAD superfamily